MDAGEATGRDSEPTSPEPRRISTLRKGGSKRVGLERDDEIGSTAYESGKKHLGMMDELAEDS